MVSPEWDTCIHASGSPVGSPAFQEAASMPPQTRFPMCETTVADMPNVVMESLPDVPSAPTAWPPSDTMPVMPGSRGTVTSTKIPPLSAARHCGRRKGDDSLRLPLAVLQLLIPELSNHMSREMECELHEEVQQLACKLKGIEQRLSSCPDLSAADCPVRSMRSAEDRQESKQSVVSEMTPEATSSTSELQASKTKAKLRDTRQTCKQVLIDMFRDLDVNYSGSVDRHDLIEGLHLLEVQENDAGRLLNGLEAENGIISFGNWRQFVENGQNAKLLQDLKDKYLNVKLHTDRSPFGHLSLSRLPSMPRSKEQAHWMLSPDSRFRCTWDAILMTLCCYLVVSLPFLVAFDSYVSEAVMSSLDSLHLSIDVLFLCDVVLNFRTGHFVGAQLVMDPRIVAKNYLRSWFVLDVISSVPFETISQGALPTFRPLKLMKLAKLARILRFLKPLLDLQESLLDGIASASRLRSLVAHSNVVLLTALICHWLACGMAIADNGWLLSYQDINGSLSRTYLAALYWSMTTMTTVGYGDIVPTADSERGFCIFAMVIGGAFYGYLIGTITEVVASADLNNLKYKERMSLVQSFVDHYKIPPHMRKRVLRYFRGIFYEKSAQSLAELTSELSPSLLKEVSCYLISHDIFYHSLFTNVPFNALIRVEALAKTLFVEAGSVVASEADAGTAMFIVTAGTCRLELEEARASVDSRERHTQRRNAIQETLVPGGSFGEEIITGLCDTYMYQVSAITNCRLMMIEEGPFVEAFEYMPSVLGIMKENAAARSIYASLLADRDKSHALY
eukprot:TRINITY_DN3951_c0_g1_i9.p1 TRINITY_DN3951_c0_g1~~TRINITY_DN3951_c0_g1_i9.p1  ORF type:complete len:790 (+),score=108.57 TRINITY_DN3951_c0_g1_i9:129-2498(+)